MTETWIAADQVFDGATLHHGAALRIVDGRVAGIDRAPLGTPRLTGTLTPGFVDLQVNGGGGVLLNTSPTADGMATIAQAHRRFGTVGILPTLITDAPEVLDRAADAALAAQGTPGVLGLHIEGPHIAPRRRGTHAERFVRPLDDRTLSVVQRLRAGGVTVMITLAPEAAQTDQIAALARMGAVVSLGHTNATAAEVEAAIAAGATCGTHLFNAMSPMTGRAPGAVGALINSDCHLGIICDGHHVNDAMVGLALRARPVPDRMMLVSDAMPTVGGPDQFSLYDQPVTLRDGRLINTEGGLAGAHVTQASGVARLVQHVGIELDAALRMAISIPAHCIDRPDLARITGRPVQDVMLLDRDLALVAPLDALLPGAAPDAAE